MSFLNSPPQHKYATCSSYDTRNGLDCTEGTLSLGANSDRSDFYRQTSVSVISYTILHLPLNQIDEYEIQHHQSPWSTYQPAAEKWIDTEEKQSYLVSWIAASEI